MEGISIKLPTTLRRKLAEEAKRRNVSQSTIVRESLENALTDHSGKQRPVSCTELVHDLVGCVRSGQSDLATNKALLEKQCWKATIVAPSVIVDTGPIVALLDAEECKR